MSSSGFQILYFSPHNDPNSKYDWWPEPKMQESKKVYDTFEEANADAQIKANQYQTEHQTVNYAYENGCFWFTVTSRKDPDAQLAIVGVFPSSDLDEVNPRFYDKGRLRCPKMVNMLPRRSESLPIMQTTPNGEKVTKFI